MLVKNATIERAEGPAKLCVTKTFPNLEAASAWLKLQWNTFPAAGDGFDKVFYSVCFENGHTYRGRLDCKRHNVPNVRDAMLKECLWMSGREKNPYCGEKQYQLYMSRLSSSIIEGFGSFLDQYAVVQ